MNTGTSQQLDQFERQIVWLWSQWNDCVRTGDRARAKEIDARLKQLSRELDQFIQRAGLR